IKAKPGKFELANEGTLFLDEIGDLPLKLQAKLLRAIQEKEIERLGGEKSIKVNTRLISATNQNLEALVKEGKFREDLYFRLNVIPLLLPPLRERLEDIPLLADFLLKKICERERKPLMKLSEDVLKAFMIYSWPGNIREFENVLERMVILSDTEVLTLESLPYNIKEKLLFSFDEEKEQQEKVETKNLVDEREYFHAKWLNLPDLEKEEINLSDLLKNIEIYYLKRALELSGGVKSKAAKLLGLNRTTLIEKLKKYNLA
ncbi:MAG: sigma 54-interacting transcriptional regulator, partial [Caldimicrobium sp.]